MYKGMTLKERSQFFLCISEVFSLYSIFVCWFTSVKLFYCIHNFFTGGWCYWLPSWKRERIKIYLKIIEEL
jgi:hypothetical protein